jgi:hypothetical protein
MSTTSNLELLSFLLETIINSDGIERRKLVSKINSVKVEIYPTEHPPPHFHVKSPEIDATFSIVKCELIKGTIDSKTKKQIEIFHQKHKQLLIDTWNETRPTDCSVGPII